MVALALLVLAGGPPPLLLETFDSPQPIWRMGEPWRLEAGRMVAAGATQKIQVLETEGLRVSDFRAALLCRRLSEPAADEVHGWGLVYRYDPAAGNGYFVDFGVGGLYGFGLIADGKFELQSSGQSRALIDGGSLELEVRGGLHALRCGGSLVDVWRHDAHRGGGLGLLVIGAVTVAFDELRVDDLGGQPPAGEPVRVQLGPQPPAPRAEAVLRPADVALATRWRRQWNSVARSLGQEPLPSALDACDLAVLALLRLRQAAGTLAPAQVLADFLGETSIVQRGAVGPGPEAAVRFWLEYARAPLELSEDADLLAALSWYFSLRQRAAAEWGERAAHPLVLSNDLLERLDGDLRRWTAAHPDEAARTRLTAAAVAACQEARGFLPREGSAAAGPLTPRSAMV